MVVFQANDVDAMRLHRLLTGHGCEAKIERFGPQAVYVVVESAPADIWALTTGAGRSVRQVYSLEELRDRDLGQ